MARNIKPPTHVLLFFPFYIMHAIIICDTPNFVGAGRQPLAAIHNLPDNYSKSSQIDCVDDAPVPAQKRVRTINRREGLAMLEGRKEGSSRSRGNRSFSGLAQWND